MDILTKQISEVFVNNIKIYLFLSNLGLNIEFYCTVVELHWGKQSKNFWHSSLENILHVSKYGCVQHMMKKNHTQTTLHWLLILHINMRVFSPLRCVLVGPHGTTMVGCSTWVEAHIRKAIQYFWKNAAWHVITTASSKTTQSQTRGRRARHRDLLIYDAWQEKNPTTKNSNEITNLYNLSRHMAFGTIIFLTY